MNNERRHPRFECTGHVDILFTVGSAPSAAKIMDLSVEGCLVELEKPHDLTKGAVVELTFKVNQLHFRVWGQARALRSGTTIGFQFPQLSARIRAQLEDLVDELSAKPMKRPSAPKLRTYIS